MQFRLAFPSSQLETATPGSPPARSSQNTRDIIQCEYLPHTRCLIFARCNDALTVGGKLHKSDYIRMALEDGEQVAITKAPDAHGLVIARCSDARSVRGQSQISDCVRMALEDSQQVTICGAPLPHRTVISSCNYEPTVRGKMHSMKRSCVPFQGQQQGPISGT